VIPERELCPECGHLGDLHRANTVDNRTPLDAPVPCYAVTGGIGPHYVYCGCTQVMPLRRKQ
jgi:hypothetical protein